MSISRLYLFQTSIFLLVTSAIAAPARGQDATWLAAPGSSDFNTATNWMPATVPGSTTPGTGTALFGTSTVNNISTSTAISLGSWVFNSNASNYVFAVNNSLTFNGAGITINGGGAVLNIVSPINFLNTSSAGSSTINATRGSVVGGINFYDGSTAGSARLSTSGGVVTQFFDRSSAANAVITNDFDGSTGFFGSSTAGNATIDNRPTSGTLFAGQSSAGNARISGLRFTGISFTDTSTAANATISTGGSLQFSGASTAGNATINSGATQGFRFSFIDHSSAGNSTITNSGDLTFSDYSTAANAFINSTGLLEFRNNSSAEAATIFAGNNTTGNLIFFDNSSGGSSRITVQSGGIFDISQLTTAGTSVGSIEGAGRFQLGTKTLTVGSNNLSTTVSGVIDDGGFANNGGGASLVKVGGGVLRLSGKNKYTGSTTVNDGALEVNGSIASSSLTAVNNGAALTGNGTVGATNIYNGGTFAPGDGTPGSSMTVSGNLALSSGAQYWVQINPTTASSTKVSGAATLGGATVAAFFANGSYVSKRYTIVDAAGGVSGTFGSLVNTNLPTNFSAGLGYDATHAYLNLTLNFAPPAYAPLNSNQENVANTLVNFFNTTGGIPMAFGSLTPAGLSRASGELGAVSQQTTFDAMDQFVGLLADPFVSGRVESSPDSPLNAYADQASDDERKRRPNDALAAIYRKVPPPVSDVIAPRWSNWASGFGGAETMNGNAVTGSSTAISRVYGAAVGIDYRISPFTLAGIAMAGGGTSSSLAAGLGAGRSDLFQAGAYMRHNAGPAYLSAALAYGWQDITTDRSVGLERLNARFDANAGSARLEAGYRVATPLVVGLTPYAAGQFSVLSLPNYRETAATPGTFALAYTAKDVTASRSELGWRSDKSFAVGDGVFTLRGRAAWAHNFDTDRSIQATFLALPGTSFVVRAAAQAGDSALVTGSAEMKWHNNWSATAVFEGEFSNVTRSYGGRGIVRYLW